MSFCAHAMLMTLVLFATAPTAGAESPAPPRSANSAARGAVVVVNAKVFTVNAKQPAAAAFAYDQRGLIIAVGNSATVMAAAGAKPTIIDARGNRVLPGFQDPHVHVPEAGINAGLCLLDAGETLMEYANALAQCAQEQADSKWVRAAGASLFDLRDGDESPLAVLDRVIPDRPALVLDDLGHAVWTNTLGLTAAHISANDPNPPGGVLHRNARTGALTGLLLEDAQQRVRNAAAVDDATVYRGLLSALAELSRNGITSISDAGGYWMQRHPAAFERALAENKLTVRAVNALYLYPSLDAKTQLAEFKKRFSNDPHSLLRYNTAKIYIDGILDLGTAALRQPYKRPPDKAYPRGFYYFKRAQLETYVSALHNMGYKLHLHVIGDAATRMALDVIEGIDADADDIAEQRHRLTHTYLVDRDDVPRFAKLGVVADFQVGPESRSTAYHDELSKIIGDRAYELIPVKTLLDAGAHVSLSSDWDADPLSPFGTIQRALLREENAVDSVERAIKLVTLDAAYALSQDDMTGSIEAGKYADFVIVDQDLLVVDPHKIGTTKVLLTVVGGRETYRAKRFGH